jgi:hypothetical protein
MAVAQPDTRGDHRRALDEQLASAPPLPPPELPAGAVAQPLEVHLQRQRRPLAVMGVVENGLVRVLDPKVKLPEQTRVIIVTAELP